MLRLATHSLISVIKLCDARCTVNFTKIGCQITYRGRVILCDRKCNKSRVVNDTFSWTIQQMDEQYLPKNLPETELNGLSLPEALRT